MLAIIAATVLLLYFGGLAALMYAILGLVFVTLFIWVSDAVTLRNRDKQAGAPVGSIYSYMRPAWRLAQENHQRSKAASTGAARHSSISLPCTFSFSYADHHGNRARRTVNITGISSSGGQAYLEGFCRSRMDNRTFRVDRIQGDLTDAETGELIPVKRLLSSVHTRSSMDYKPLAPAPKSSTTKEWKTAVFFAGFRGGKLDELEGLAAAAGWQIRWTISPTVDYVVRNGSAGKKQLAEADNLGIDVIDEDTFRALL